MSNEIEEVKQADYCLPTADELALDLHKYINHFRAALDFGDVQHMSKKERIRTIQGLQKVLIEIVEFPVERTQDDLTDTQVNICVIAGKTKQLYTMLSMQMIAEANAEADGTYKELTELEVKYMKSQLVNLDEMKKIIQENLNKQTK